VLNMGVNDKPPSESSRQGRSVLVSCHGVYIAVCLLQRRYLILSTKTAMADSTSD
jgi:hypothetical protein